MAASATGKQRDRDWDKAGHLTRFSSSRPLQDKDSPAQIITVKLPSIATRADKPPESSRVQSETSKGHTALPVPSDLEGEIQALIKARTQVQTVPKTAHLALILRLPGTSAC